MLRCGISAKSWDVSKSGALESQDVEFERETVTPGTLLLLVAGAVVVGGLTGLLGTAFLMALEHGNSLRLVLTDFLRQWPPAFGWLALCALVAAAAAAAAWMVERFAPTAQGSGVPYVEKILRGGGEPSHRHVIPVKFLGGWLALSAGLVLGREGPMVQMGAVVGEKIGRRLPGSAGAWKSLMAAGSGAGLASAFNAPVGGTLFVLEEVFRRITPVTFLLAATAASVSVFVQRAVFGLGQDYQVPVVGAPPVSGVWMFLLFGAVVGGLGVLYNRLLLWLVAVSTRLSRIPVAVRAAAIGFVIGTVAWFAPQWVGGGDDIAQSILNSQSHVWLLVGAAVLRYFIGPLSYAARTPGGLFAPVIALGAICGAVAGLFFHAVLPALAPSPLAFVVAGMAAFFCATVRAPLTGIVICLEMTGSYALFFPMLATCLGAYLIPTLLRDSPIYDALATQKT